MKQGNYALDVSLALLLADEDTDEDTDDDDDEDADEEEEALSEALSLFFSAAEEGSGGVSGVALGATGLTTSDALSGVGGTDSTIDSDELSDAPDSDETSRSDSVLGGASGLAAGAASASECGAADACSDAGLELVSEWDSLSLSSEEGVAELVTGLDSECWTPAFFGAAAGTRGTPPAVAAAGEAPPGAPAVVVPPLLGL